MQDRNHTTLVKLAFDRFCSFKLSLNLVCTDKYFLRCGKRNWGFTLVIIQFESRGQKIWMKFYTLMLHSAAELSLSSAIFLARLNKTCTRKTRIRLLHCYSLLNMIWKMKVKVKNKLLISKVRKVGKISLQFS